KTGWSAARICPPRPGTGALAAGAPRRATAWPPRLAVPSSRFRPREPARASLAAALATRSRTLRRWGGGPARWATGLSILAPAASRAAPAAPARLTLASASAALIPWSSNASPDSADLAPDARGARSARHPPGTLCALPPLRHTGHGGLRPRPVSRTDAH